MLRSLCLVVASIFLVATTAHASFFPKVVSELDLERYLGTWYEVASTKPIFQLGCVCVTAKYALREDGKVQVLNSCRKNDVNAPLNVTEGVASPSDHPAKFNVQFGPFPTPGTNYWVVDLADDYSYAVVSSPFRQPIWILSRTPSLPQETLDGIYQRLSADGFFTPSLSATLQEGCPAE